MLTLYSGDVTKGFDSTFWFGDSNFRLAATGGRATVDEIIKGIELKKSETFEKLVNLDELRKAQNEGKHLDWNTSLIFNFMMSY